MPAIRGRAAVPVAVIAAALLGACQGASFSALSEGGSPGGHGRHRARHHEEIEGPAETKVAYAPGEGPRVVFPEAEYDFGQVAQGEKVSHTFKVRNEGKAVLHIKRVRGS